MYKLLLVEDEKNFASVLKDYLKMNNFEVELCENGEEASQLFKPGKFDLCILDVMMPKKDGYTLAGEIRAIDKTVPLLFLTARGMREDVIKGYKLGADDYITKPFDSELFLLKVNVILGRNKKEGNETPFIHQLGHFNFNAKMRTLATKKGEDIKLSPKESELLNLLCEHKNNVLPREKALKQIWKEDTYFTGRSMDVYIVKLRKYLASDSSVEISNLHGNGYSLKVK